MIRSTRYVTAGNRKKTANKKMTGITFEMSKTILHPGLIMAGFGVLVMLLPRICRRPLCLIAPIGALWALFQLNEESALPYEIAPYIHLEFIHMDGIAYVFMLASCMIAVIISVYGTDIQKKNEGGMSLIYAGSIMGVILAGDCISLVLCWGVSAAASMYLIYAGQDKAASGASFRYILMHASGGGLFLIGFIVYMFHYGNTLGNIASCFGEPCFWLIAAGLAISAAVPPVNAWLPDSYPESTASGTVYLSSFTIPAAICIMIRLFSGLEALVWVGAIAAIYAAVMAILENDIRRTLSYNLIGQLGMMIAAVGTGGEPGADAAAAHAVTNIMSMGVLMMATGAVVHSTGKRKITDLSGLSRKMPVTAVCFLISSLAITGLPGLSGFISIIPVRNVLSEAGYAIPMMLITAGSIGALLSITLKINWFVFFGPCKEADMPKYIEKLPVTMDLAMIAGTILTILIGVMPAEFCSLMPYETLAVPYSVKSILESAAILIGGSIPFFLFLKWMKPDDKITLDFDWFRRRWLSRFVSGLSRATYDLFRKLG